MMQIIFIMEYWRSQWPERQEELDKCIRSNITQSYTKRVMLNIEPSAPAPFFHPKLVYALLEDRTYRSIFECASNYFAGEICCVCNSDIYFEENLPETLARFDFDKQALALSRWNIDFYGRPPYLFDCPGSYDAYFFKAPLYLPGADFTPGVCGCDGALAYLMAQQREVLNPARSVRAMHLHLTCLRTYDPEYNLPHQRLQVPVTG